MVRACTFLTGVGEFEMSERTEVFFLIDRGSIGVAAVMALVPTALGVDSVFSV